MPDHVLGKEAAEKGKTCPWEFLLRGETKQVTITLKWEKALAEEAQGLRRAGRGATDTTRVREGFR